MPMRANISRRSADLRSGASSAKIATIETFPLNYPTVGWFRFFEGVKGRPSGRSAVLVKITADNGEVGWGQSVPAHRWSYETRETVQSTINCYTALGPIRLE